MNGASGRILVVDDDSGIRRALHAALEPLGFAVAEARNGEDALALVRDNSFNAVLLDVNMPGMGGMQACREIRRVARLLPILMLTVRDSQEDIIKALEIGADDYIKKPFHFRELVARLRAAVRRSVAFDNQSQMFSIGDVQLDSTRRLVKKKGKQLHLTPKEFDLLHYLMAHPGEPLSHARLLRAVWGPEYGSELEYLRTFVRQLRVKIEDNPASPVYLLTDPYIGYRFCAPAIASVVNISVESSR